LKAGQSRDGGFPLAGEVAPAGPVRRGRETVLAVLFFLGYTLLATWPQAMRLEDGLTDLWDAKLSAWILHWDYAQTFRDPLNLFHAPILYPARYVLAFSENLYGAAVFGFPVLASGASAVFNYNVVLLLGMFLSAISAWALARYVTGDPLASLVAGLVYGFLPYRLAQLAHFHMQWGPFLCLVFLYLLRYLDRGMRRDALLLGVFFAWNAIACIQYAFFTGFLVAVVLAVEAVGGEATRWRRIGGALLAIGAACVVCLPFAIPYKRASDIYQMRRSVGEMTFFSARPGYFLSAGERNKLYGPLTARWRGPEGDFFPGLVAPALAVLAIVRLRGRSAEKPEADEISPRRRRTARRLDILIVLLVGLWCAAVRFGPHIQVGPLKLGDAGRIQVFLTIAILLRLSAAFPNRSRYRSLGDFLWRQSLDRRALLLLVVASTGVLVALGGHTPYYRFLFQSFGTIFRAIRVAARGVVLFQIALAVLAAWGLSLWTRRWPRLRRTGSIGGVIALMTLEYRAFPISMFDYDSKPVPVYEWLKTVGPGGGVVELPLGFPHDCEYTFRQAEHGKPILNGHSSFSPRQYNELQNLFETRPVPEEVWSRVRSMGGVLVIFHPHEVEGLARLNSARAVRKAVSEGKLEVLGSFKHDLARDFVFRIAPAPPFPTRIAPADRDRAAADFTRLTTVAETELAPPFGVIDIPAENADVAAGSFGLGWALDDSGIAEIRVATELGPGAPGTVGGARPDIPPVYPDYADAANSGFGFLVPNVPPGPHTVTITLVGKDGGRTVLTRPIRVR
jgi:hypothetical protein